MNDTNSKDAASHTYQRTPARVLIRAFKFQRRSITWLQPRLISHNNSNRPKSTRIHQRKASLRLIRGIGAILKPLYDAEQTFVGRFTPQMAMQVIGLGDAYWTPKSHDTVQRRRRYDVERFCRTSVRGDSSLAQPKSSSVMSQRNSPTTTEELDVEESNDEEEYNPLAEACDRIRELEAEVGTSPPRNLKPRRKPHSRRPQVKANVKRSSVHSKRVTGGGHWFFNTSWNRSSQHSSLMTASASSLK